MQNSELLFYGGILIMSIAVIGHDHKSDHVSYHRSKDKKKTGRGVWKTLQVKDRGRKWYGKSNLPGVYEIQQKIGSGGGGIVYLGRHLRLNKLVVLKADKRSLNTKPEILRREVDMLKGLSHRYIPQVYDFVQEDGIVYTVMDYIEGESLDHILERGQTPPNLS